MFAKAKLVLVMLAIICLGQKRLRYRQLLWKYHTEKYCPLTKKNHAYFSRSEKSKSTKYYRFLVFPVYIKLIFLFSLAALTFSTFSMTINDGSLPLERSHYSSPSGQITFCPNTGKNLQAWQTKIITNKMKPTLPIERKVRKSNLCTINHANMTYICDLKLSRLLVIVKKVLDSNNMDLKFWKNFRARTSHKLISVNTYQVKWCWVFQKVSIYSARGIPKSFQSPLIKSGETKTFVKKNT